MSTQAGPLTIRPSDYETRGSNIRDWDDDHFSDDCFALSVIDDESMMGGYLNSIADRINNQVML